jgi:Tfp pilus assembly protein PilF
MRASPSRALALPFLLLLAVVPVAGCARREPVPDPASPGARAAVQARAQALIEAGNTSYRAGDHTTAAKRYAAAVVVKPDDPAAHFGLGMALTKLGRDEEARLAYARARELAQQARGAGADTAH